MGSLGYVQTLLNGLRPEDRTLLRLAFAEAVERATLGGAVKATNFGWYRVESTTPSSSNTEFAVAHGLSQAPSWIVPVLDVTSSGMQTVPLKVTRPADATYLYLQSTSTSAIFRVFVEG